MTARWFHPLAAALLVGALTLVGCKGEDEVKTPKVQGPIDPRLQPAGVSGPGGEKDKGKPAVRVE